MLSANPWSQHTAGLLEFKTQAFRSFWLSASKSGGKKKKQKYSLQIEKHEW